MGEVVRGVEADAHGERQQRLEPGFGTEGADPHQEVDEERQQNAEGQVQAQAQDEFESDGREGGLGVPTGGAGHGDEDQYDGQGRSVVDAALDSSVRRAPHVHLSAGAVLPVSGTNLLTKCALGPYGLPPRTACSMNRVRHEDTGVNAMERTRAPGWGETARMVIACWALCCATEVVLWLLAATTAPVGFPAVMVLGRWFWSRHRHWAAGALAVVSGAAALSSVADWLRPSWSKGFGDLVATGAGVFVSLTVFTVVARRSAGTRSGESRHG